MEQVGGVFHGLYFQVNSNFQIVKMVLIIMDFPGGLSLIILPIKTVLEICAAISILRDICARSVSHGISSVLLVKRSISALRSSMREESRQSIV